MSGHVLHFNGMREGDQIGTAGMEVFPSPFSVDLISPFATVHAAITRVQRNTLDTLTKARWCHRFPLAYKTLEITCSIKKHADTKRVLARASREGPSTYTHSLSFISLIHMQMVFDRLRGRLAQVCSVCICYLCTMFYKTEQCIHYSKEDPVVGDN